MFYAACVKAQLNDEPPLIIDFNDTGFIDRIADTPNANPEDLAIFALLSPFFAPSESSFNEGWMLLLPQLRFSPQNPESFTMVGRIFDKPSAPSYPDNKTGLACFNSEVLREYIGSMPLFNIDMERQQWQDMIQSTPINELQDLLSSYGQDGSAIGAAPATLRITRCSSAEIQQLDPWGGLDFPYVDIFDFVKARLPNNVDLLNQKGLAPAKYYPEGDYIEFSAEHTITFAAFISTPVNMT